MSYITLHKFLEKANSSADHTSAIKTDSVYIKRCLYEAYSEWETFYLPEGAPEYESPEGDSDIAPMKLLTPQAMRYFDHFKNKNTSKHIRENLFIRMLRDLSFEESRCLIAIKDKKLHELYPNITREVVDNAFPDLLVMKGE